VADFPSVPLGDLVLSQDGRRRPIRASERESGPFPYYGASGVIDSVGDYIFDGLHLLIAEDGENLRTRKTPVAFLADGKFWVNNHAHVVVANDKADTRYLCYAVESSDISGFLTGSTQPKLTQAALLKLPVIAPPLEEQRAIATVLGALDDKIESNRRIVKQIELVLLAHSNSLSTLPRVALHEVSKSYRRPVNPLVLGDEWVDHFSLPAFDVAAMPERCQASSIMSGKFGIETTSVLISRLNPDTPRVWCASVREVPAMCSSEFLVLEPLKKSSVGALWLAAVHPSLREQMVQRATGTSFSHQRIKSDDALSVEVPDIRMIDEQTRGECDELIAMVGKQRGETEYLSRLRDVLLPELLSGRLRVKDAESMMESV
jgi:type I restriction enzyme S subunit